MRVEYHLLASQRRHYARFRLYLSLFVCKMPQSVENSADCEIHFVICFLNAKDLKATEIHRQISEVYEENIMSEGMMRKWVTAFKVGCTNVHNEERTRRSSVITEDLLQKVDGKVQENRLFTISSLSNEFPQVSRSVLYGIVTEHLSIGVGEQCGGPLNIFGVCVDHLSCVHLPEGEPDDPTHASNTVGICIALP
ncbi:hypothetical protein AVEN_257010-1 [Araneus ventricosus]|uniref:Mos1 transposase HTH domain-containing protein n=1 Tax=Araneus ventricosus TaxID=182803 RepID=A0A4Y2T551_ARAVE|nr:hypothetical protein AVEN_257010-1 [Araneus ventricosus]